MTDNSKLLTEIPFDLPGKIYRSPMPFGPYDRQGRVWQLYQEQNINQIVILIEKQEYLVHAHRDLPKFYRAEGLDVIHFPIPDFRVPVENGDFSKTVEKVLSQAQDGRNLAIHCLAGIGRTGIFLACMTKRHFGLDARGSIEWVRQFIPGALENSDQEQFVLDF